MFLTKEELIARNLHKLCELLVSTALMAAIVSTLTTIFMWGM